MKMETAQGYVDRLGPQFHKLITDPRVRLDTITKRYGVSRPTLMFVRHLLIGTKPKKVVRGMVATPQMIALFKSDLSSREIGEKLGLTLNVVNHQRRKYRPNTKIKSLRYDEATIALLKSNLPIKDIARALKVTPPTVYKNRQELLKRKRNYNRQPLDADLVARVYACPDPKTATLETGVCLFTTRALFVRRKIQAGGAPKATRNSKLAHRFPSDPDWWAARTREQIMRALKVSAGSVFYHALTRGYTYKRMLKIEA
jgi:DNA-binding CsgD family transcriptional regulator